MFMQTLSRCRHPFVFAGLWTTLRVQFVMQKIKSIALISELSCKAQSTRARLASNDQGADHKLEIHLDCTS